jgi:hypothetical protein
MLLRRLHAVGSEELLTATFATLATALLAFAGEHKLGDTGLLLPLAAIVVIIMVSQPLVMVSTVVVLVVVCEGPQFGLLRFTTHLYDHATVLNVLVALAVVSVGIDMVRHRRPLHLPAPLGMALLTLALAMMVGAATGRAAGVALGQILHSYNNLAYLLFLPIAVANLNLSQDQLRLLLKGAMGLAIFKATLGLLEVFGGYGVAIEGESDLTYYEPTANWLTMIAGLTVVSALAIRARPSRSTVLSSFLLIACLLLSYRRSFWIAGVLAIVLVILLGISPSARRVLIPTIVIVGVAIWLLGSTNFQSQSPIVRRAASLAPSSLQTNIVDRYRLDERANALGAIKQSPVTGLGMDVPWPATFRTPSIEYIGGRLYVHFVAVWYWLKLGIIGLLAYGLLMLSGLVMGFQTWRRRPPGMESAFGLASMCGLVGLMVAETTASFTGVDPRFTVVIGAQLGLLAILSQPPRATDVGEAAPGLR